MIQLADLKYYRKGLSFIFWHERKIRVLIFFKYFDVLIAYIVEFVIRVERRSRRTRVMDLGELKRRINPLSVKFMHFENRSIFREFKYWD